MEPVIILINSERGMYCNRHIGTNNSMVRFVEGGETDSLNISKGVKGLH